MARHSEHAAAKGFSKKFGLILLNPFFSKKLELSRLNPFFSKNRVEPDQPKFVSPYSILANFFSELAQPDFFDFFLT